MSDITSDQYLKQLRSVNTSGLFSEHEIIAHGYLCEKEGFERAKTALHKIINKHIKFDTESERSDFVIDLMNELK